MWKEAPLGGLFLVAHEGGVFEINDRILGFDLQGQQVLNSPLPIDESLDGDILDVRWNGQFLVFDTAEETIVVDVRGNRVAPDVSPHSGCNSRITEEVGSGAAPFSLSVDGAFDTKDGTWLWNDDGMLLVVKEPQCRIVTGRAPD